MSVGPDPASIGQEATEGSGWIGATGQDANGAQRAAERTALVELIRAPYSWTWSLPTTQHAEQIADAILAAGYVRVPIELVEVPRFQGCTDSNPDNCACSDSPVCCDACGDEIDEGSQVYSAVVPCRPWAAPESPSQDWQVVWWHTNCDLRGGSVSGGDLGV